MNHKTNILIFFVLSFFVGCSKKQEPQKPNILFIAIDDLRPELNSFGVKLMKTPNIDKLALRGLQFNSHYVQHAVCIPSRVSLLTSLRSERTHQIYGPNEYYKVEGVKTFSNTFREAGYTTVSLGKIWHLDDEMYTDTFDVQWNADQKFNYALEQNQAHWTNFLDQRKIGKREIDIFPLAPITECADVNDTAYIDGKIAKRAVEELKRLKKQKKPFVLSVGFIRPHLPFTAPKKYWDLYNEDEMGLAPNPNFPEDMPEVAFSNHPNLFMYGYEDYPPFKKGDEKMPDKTARHLRHGYRAATSYTDAMVGLVLDELKKLGLDNNTIVVLWGDHGWHLGDTGHWGKQTNFEAATRSPLIIRVPWIESAIGQTKAFVETVDIFPTLIQLCQLPPLPVTDGQSFLPILQNPDTEIKSKIYHVFHRWRVIDGERTTIIGYAVRNKRYRYISWRLGWGLNKDEVANELYDYEKDPLETKNLVNDSTYSDVVQQMKTELRNGPAGIFTN
jgi:iduronate 2-sulfatase